METIWILITAVAIAMLALFVFKFVAKLCLFAIKAAAKETASVSFTGDLVGIFISVLVIALYFLIF